MNGDGYVTGIELGEFLFDRVTNYSKGAQHPQWGKIRNGDLDKGDFVFKLDNPCKTSCITVIIKNASGEVIHPVDDIYAVKIDETIAITVDVTNPQNHEIEVTWTAGHGNVSSKNKNTATYQAEKIEVDYVLIRIIDKDTDEKLQKPINLAIVP
jgi:hypothetical protein